MPPDTLIVAASAFAGSVVAVVGAFHFMLSAMKADITEVKASTLDAHKRMNQHLVSHAK